MTTLSLCRIVGHGIVFGDQALTFEALIIGNLIAEKRQRHPWSSRATTTPFYRPALLCETPAPPEGWGAQFLVARRPDGHWGRGFYQSKWLSTHYTLLDLRRLDMAPDHPQICASISQILAQHKSADGGINPAGTIKNSDVCIM